MKVAPVGRRSFVYANNNYLLLGLIAEQVGHDKLARQLEREFFGPLGMRHTYFLPGDRHVPDGLIDGYDEYIPFGPHDIAPANTAWSSLAFAAGAMASTSEDLLIWLDALFHNRVLKPETLQLSRIYLDARRNGRDDSIVGYGLGLAQYELNGHKMEGHPGGGFGGECFPFYVPDKDVSIVVQYNWSKKDNPAGKVLVTRIIEQLLNDPNLRIK
jgi:D-alanyl-D-alanine carboxypeptidase